MDSKGIKIFDLKLLVPEKINDERGFFVEIFSRKNLNLGSDFLQENQSFSIKQETIRGLHFQAPPHAQAKLVRCIRGSIFDVAVDIRKNSPSFGQWAGYELSAENGHQLFIPEGFAHGFVTLQPETEVLYKCSDYYAPQSEGGIRWNDPTLKIDWPLTGEPILSKKDANAPFLSQLDSPFVWEG